MLLLLLLTISTVGRGVLLAVSLLRLVVGVAALLLLAVALGLLLLLLLTISLLLLLAIASSAAVMRLAVITTALNATPEGGGHIGGPYSCKNRSARAVIGGRILIQSD